MATQRRPRGGSVEESINNVENQATGGLPEMVTPTQISGMTSPTAKLVDEPRSLGFWNDIITMQWMRYPVSSFKLLLIPITLYLFLATFIPTTPNVFARLLFISGNVPSSPDDPRYRKTYWDLAFVVFYIVFFSFVRQFVTLHVFRPLALWRGIKKESTVNRVGEQGYAVLYFSVVSAWGIHVMSGLPTWWYDTKYFWIDYPHWNMPTQLKWYYLVQTAYWCQQLLVLALKMEKPRKDYHLLIAHHVVTLWLIGWSYLINLTRIGNAVYLSMDLPDALLALALGCDHLRSNAKVIAFAALVPAWSYFRIWLNIKMLSSVWFEFGLMPQTSKRWYTPDGVWLVWWMKYQVLAPLFLLLFLNLYWYFLILRILWRGLFGPQLTDLREEEDENYVDQQKD